MAFTQIVCVSETDAQAEADYFEAVKYFYRYTNRVSRGFTSAPGYRSPQSMTWELERQQSNPDRERAYKGELSFREYDEKGFIIAGSPATVRQRLREVVTELRVGQLIATPHIGNLSEETARKNTFLFATEVIPYLRDIWAEYPDHWTPKVSQERVAQAAVNAKVGVAGD
jgi:alkanesulfonate monooxygenase SsuD/methylene tetrahydromethanopterin reductase-like flavin-dependent oxidoreductase (luciferase family)